MRKMFEIIGSIETIFKILLASIVDFTIPKSSCHIYYQDLKGVIFNKSFYKDSDEGFFINGYVNSKNKNVNLFK